MNRTIIALVAFSASLLAATTLLAASDQYLGDLSIYSARSYVQPNVLIIIDNSGSMQDSVPGEAYDPLKTYPVVKACGYNGSVACSPTAVYNADNYNSAVNNVSAVTNSCNGSAPRDLLREKGRYSGRSLTSSGDCARRGTNQYYLGNYVNYLRNPASAMRPKIDIAKDVVKEIIATTSGVKLGVMTFRYSGNTGQGSEFLETTVSGTNYVTTIKKMDDIFTGTITNRTALMAAVDALYPRGNTPLGEALYEAMRYFGGSASAFVTSGKYTSPVDYSCQENRVIFVSDGMANADNDSVLKTLCTNGDCDGDSKEPNDLNHVLDDVAKALNVGPQKVITTTIGFGLTGADAEAVALLERAGDDAHGKGGSHLPGSQQELIDAFIKALSTLRKQDTSIAAPAPSSSTIGNRLYLTFLKPDNTAFWRGNLKKYAISLDNDLNIMDAAGNVATTEDGSLKVSARSYWSSSADGKLTDQGGAGKKMQTTLENERNIFTTTLAGTSRVAFDTTNITAAMLGVSDNAARDELVNFIRGLDVDDTNNNGSTTDNRAWLMGDILHSRPQIVKYAPFPANKESDCSANTSVIYAGGNDGMLHAFQDCNGSELWGFIPPEMLQNLKLLRGQDHTYFVDATPVPYIYDAKDDGIIDATKGDKVILLFGSRRGGASYYALNVTNPSSPEILWRISGNMPDFAELAESWSEPKLVKMKIGTNDTIVAVIGAGYDHLNEDGRYGATQGFSGTGTVSLGDMGDGAVTSTGTELARNPKGRGVYLVEIAKLGNGGVPNFDDSGTKVRGFTNSDYSSMDFSFPSEITAIDLNNSGYTSRLYAADTGGNIWRFDVGDPDKAKWSARKFFSSNPGSGGASDVGRKIFIKPSVVAEAGKRKILFFGTGDREHPLNSAIINRIYAVIDDDNQTEALTETDLMDVTADELQTTTIASGTGSIADLLDKLSEKKGWYIKLDQYSGEKVLSPPLMLNKTAHFATYTPPPPDAEQNLKPCDEPDDIGTARLYSLDYKTGDAVINYDKTNDSTATTNKRAKTASGVLLRKDREKTIGSGIASGPVAVVSPGGNVKLLLGVDGNIVKEDPRPGGGIIPLYWRQK